MTKKDNKFIDINKTRAEQDIDMDEVLMQRVADAILDEELKAVDEACEKYKDWDFEEDEDVRLQAIFAEYDKRNKKKNRAAKTKRFAKIAAVIVLALGVFGTAGYFSTTEAFRAELLNLIFKAHDKYDEVVIDENNQQDVDKDNSVDDNSNISDSEADGKFALQLDYVPEGYELVKNDSDNLIYENIKNREQYIRLSYTDVNDNKYMDNEDFASEQIYRNGWEIDLRYNDIDYTAIWQDKGQHFSLSATYLDKDTFLKIIENVSRTDDD